MRKIILILFISIFFFGCGYMDEEGKDENVADPIPLEDTALETEYEGLNNSAVLSGGSIGLNEFDNAVLQKRIPVTLINAEPNFKLLKSSLTRKNESITLSVDWITEIRNQTSNKAFCGIKFEGVQFKAGDENLTAVSIISRLIGSIGIADSEDFASCLAPGQSGYIIQKVTAADLDLFENLTRVEVAGITVESVSVIDHNIKLIPSAYTVDSGKIKAEITNTDSDTGYIFPGDSYFILLDSEGFALYYGKFSGLMAVKLETGQTGAIETTEISYGGSATKMRIFVDLGVDAWGGVL